MRSGERVLQEEFLYVDDLADACLFLMKNYSGNDFFNIGTGEDITIKELAEMISEMVGYKGELKFDTSNQMGHPGNCWMFQGFIRLDGVIRQSC